MTKQKQRLAYNAPQIPETLQWPNDLDDSEPDVQLEKNVHDIGETCRRARALLEMTKTGTAFGAPLVDMIIELHSLDRSAASWRQTPRWAFSSIAVSDRPDLIPVARGITDTIQLHPDVWMAYEWNYHRASRILFLQRLLDCCEAALGTGGLREDAVRKLNETVADCVSTIHRLASEVLATVPQSFGDVDHTGRLHDIHDGPPRCRAIGAYLLLWPARTIKSEASAISEEHRISALRVFERIREYTGMKRLLGDKSVV